MKVVDESQAAKFYNLQPKKRVTASMLIFDITGRVLIVKPNYIDGWLYPGGGVEINESPYEAAFRECQEEIGVALNTIWPAYINYVSPQPSGQDDMMQCLFTTEAVNVDFLKTLTLQKDEIDDAKFVVPEALEKYVGVFRAKATHAYLQHATTHKMIYMENGEIV